MSIRKKYLTINKYSRPNRPLKEVKAIVIHWVENPNISAEGVRHFFENRKKGNSGYGSAHFIIDPKEIIQCMDDTEVAYHCGTSKPISSESNQVYTDFARKKFGEYCTNYKSNSPNNVTIGIELCHYDWEGRFDPKTIKQAIKLITSLCIDFGLNPLEDIVTHNQIVGWKDCPRWFTNNPESFEKFKAKINDYYLKILDVYSIY